MAVRQPAGTVTFVFTDIEGSTRLLEELGTEEYRSALAEHRRIVREACGRHAGYEVDYEGDAFFYAFATAQAAVAAVTEAMTGLDGGPIRIRVGIHTGEPALDPPKYIGMDVHQAARIMSCAHGGQVVLSLSTVSLLSPGTVELLDLGEHRLKDLSSPIPLYQLLVDGLPAEFPPLKSLYRSNLPVPATPFLGREREVAELVALLGRDDVRLLTLTGPGGIGKTRLALQAAAEAADHFRGGVTWVPLAPLRDPALLLSTIAQAVGVREQPGRDAVSGITERLAGTSSLLLLDNAEHLLPEAGDLVAELHAIEGPTLLVTSRERLQLLGERALPVLPLAETDAVELFLARAADSGAELERSAGLDELCRRLEGLPLALELAAARMPLFDAAQLLERLGQRLDLLRGARNADPRQRTLRATIEWSYELLAASERALFARLSVFAGGGTYEACEVVCDADPDTLQSLVDKSLVRRRDAPGGPRYWMLETIREFAAECLSPGETGALTTQLASYLQIAFGVSSPVLGASFAGDPEWHDRVGAEVANIRVALHSASEDAIGPLAYALYLHAYLRGGLVEARGWLERALELETQPTRVRCALLGARVNAMVKLGIDEPVTETAAEAVAIARELDDLPVVVAALRDLSLAEMLSGDEAAAVRTLEESRDLARWIGDRAGEMGALMNLSHLELEADRWERALELSRQATAIADELPAWEGMAIGRYNQAVALLETGQPDPAAPLLRRALEIADVNDWAEGRLYPLELLAWVIADGGDPEHAARLIGFTEGLRADLALPATERVHTERIAEARAACRRALGEDRFDAARADGALLDVDGALALAR